jgi:hypothetical protein
VFAYPFFKPLGSCANDTSPLFKKLPLLYYNNRHTANNIQQLSGAAVLAHIRSVRIFKFFYPFNNLLGIADKQQSNGTIFFGRHQFKVPGVDGFCVFLPPQIQR